MSRSSSNINRNTIKDSNIIFIIISITSSSSSRSSNISSNSRSVAGSLSPPCHRVTAPIEIYCDVFMASDTLVKKVL